MFNVHIHILLINQPHSVVAYKSVQNMSTLNNCPKYWVLHSPKQLSKIWASSSVTSCPKNSKLINIICPGVAHCNQANLILWLLCLVLASSWISSSVVIISRCCSFQILLFCNLCFLIKIVTSYISNSPNLLKQIKCKHHTHL